MNRCVLIFLLLISAHLRAQPPLRFTSISSRSGLSSDAVQCMIQDHRGFVWIGTSDGLNLYDGTAFKIYRHNRFDSTSICNNDIRSIAEDADGTLWLGTLSGVSHFDPLTGKAVTYIKGKKQKELFSDAFVCHILIDAEQHVWVYNPSGVGLFDKAKNVFVPFFNAHQLDRTGQKVHSFFIDAQKRKWVGTDGSLCLVNEKGSIVQEYFPVQGGALVDCITQDKKGNLWLGTWGSGFFRFTTGTKKFEQCLFNERPVNPSAENIVTAVFITSDTLLWLGTNQGLYRLGIASPDFTENTESIAHYLNDSRDAHSLAGVYAGCFMQENNGDVWVGTDKGASVLFRKNGLFTTVPGIKGDIMEMLFTPDKIYTCAWYGDGLVEYDKDLIASSVMERLPPGSPDPDNGQISDVVIAKDGSLWAATFNGLVHVVKEGQYVIYSAHKGDTAGLSSNRINSIAEDDEGNIWIATYGEGINKYLIKEDRFVRYNSAVYPALFCSNLAWTLFKSSNGNIYCGTNEGIMKYDVHSKKFTCISSITENGRTIPLSIASSFCETKSGELWIGCDNGLFRMKNEELTYFSTEDGLCNQSISGMAEDEPGNLWIGTANGLSCYITKENKFINYDQQDGLPSSNIRALFGGDDGKVYLNMSGAVLAFSPAAMYGEKKLNSIFLTGIEFSGTYFSSGASISSTLSYDQNDLTVNFISPCFSAPGKISYRYILAGAYK
jgi:ligand-binding sensor domain-containing protein